MLKLLLIVIAVYLSSKYLEPKGYDLPLIAWIGMGFILGMIF